MAQIVLFNVSNDEKYLPQHRDMFNAARWNEAKRLFAQVLKQHSKEASGDHNGQHPERHIAITQNNYKQIIEELKDTMAQAAVWYKTNIIDPVKY